MHFSGLGKTPLRADNAKWSGTLCVLRFRMGIHMNVCLLRHLSKLHDSGSMPAPNYIVNKYGWSPIHDLGTRGNAATPVWRDIFKSLNFFRSITSVKIGNGATTSFSNDLWLPNHQTTLACQFHALFSHSNRQSASIAWVLASPELNLDLTPRLYPMRRKMIWLHYIVLWLRLT